MDDYRAIPGQTTKAVEPHLLRFRWKVVYRDILGADFDFVIFIAVRLRGHELQVRKKSAQGETSNHLSNCVSNMKINIAAKLYIITKRINQTMW